MDFCFWVDEFEVDDIPLPGLPQRIGEIALEAIAHLCEALDC